MEHAKGMHPGAVWKKTDFQIHTPRDPNWKGEHLAGGGGALEAKRFAWTHSFLDSCLEKGLTAVALTDHHDICFSTYVQKVVAENDKYSSLWFFPGMEITCNDSSQCIVVFDADTESTIITRLFAGALKDIVAPELTTAKAPSADHCGRDLVDFVEEVRADKFLQDICIVLPNGSEDGGHKTIMRHGFSPRFKQLNCDGVYCEHDIAKYGGGTLRIIRGEVPAWSERRRGIISTSDNRQSDFSDLGKFPTWIRLGEPTAEAIRQALLVDEARICYEQPKTPSHRLLELKVTSKLCGTDFQVSFNDGFNAFIGGRGAGKSAILEYLRFVIGRSNVDFVGTGPGVDRNKKFITETLGDGEVEILLERNGLTETWRRNLIFSDKISVATDGGQVEEIPIDVATKRFPARAFNQGQLSSLIAPHGAAETQITSIAAANFLEQRRAIEQELEKAKREVENRLGRLIDYWIAENRSSRTESDIKDVKRQLEAINSKLTSVGISPEQQATLNDETLYKLANSYIADGQRLFESWSVNLTETLNHYKKQFADLEINEISKFPAVHKFQVAAEQLLEKLSKTVDECTGEISDARKVAVEAAEIFNSDNAVHMEKLASAKEQLSAHTSTMTEKSGLEDRLVSLDRDLKIQKAELDGFGDARSRLQQSVDTLLSKVKDKNKLLEEACQQVAEVSQGIIRASVSWETLPKLMRSALQGIGNGLRIQNLGDRIDDQLRDVLTKATPSSWSGLSEALLEAFRVSILERQQGQTDVVEEVLASLAVKSALFGGITPTQSSTLLERLDQSKMAAILTAYQEPYISFEYNDNGDYIDFEKASPGQQAAALLELLLGQAAGTLIIDQPEDDLDNKVIGKIVEVLRMTKSNRQLIFATHNPNFVVNGDADKIVALGATKGGGPRVAVLADGAIETPVVREAITDIMEGGKDAFELRRRKYKFE
ncbi:TrlF family AAA-like ATPase [Kordiimonas sp.]|uniref:TrlF family AAA-like ATPase n=1 Tax=Kordiimonas sp. TaxID=1970157 RepID=UPI003A8CDB2F